MFKSFLFGLIFLFSACQKAPNLQNKQIVRLNIACEPQTLDPRRARNLNDVHITKMFFEGLTRATLSDQPELAAAESYSVSDDGRIYTFTLRPHHWSNGDPVTAQDFVRTWQSTLSPNFPADNAFQLYTIKNAKAIKNGQLSKDTLGAKAIDSKTLSIELTAPHPYYLKLLSSPIYFPVHVSEDLSISNGPFKLAKWLHHDHIDVYKNSNYWNAQSIRLDGLKMLMVPDDTALKLFEQGQLDWEGSPYSTIPIDAIAHLRRKKILHTAPFLATRWIRINTAKDPFKNRNMRKAFAYALNRQDIVKHLTQGGQEPATAIVPAILGLHKLPLFTDADTHMAKSLFAKPQNSITLLYAASDYNHKMAQAIQNQWQNVFDITINLEGVESKVYFDKVSRQDYQLALGSWVADFADPISILEVFKSKASGINNTNWENPIYTRLLEESNSTFNPEQRKHLLCKAEQLLIEEMPVIPIHTFTMLYLKNDKLKNEQLSSTGALDFRYAYLEE